MLQLHPLPPPVVEMLGTLDGAILLTDAAGTIVLFNPEAEKLFGYDAADVLGKPVEILLPEAQRMKHARLREDYGRAPRARPLISGLKLTGRRRDGRRFPAEIELAPIHTDSGLFVASTVREVPAEDTRGEFFRMILESAPDAMIITDDHGRISVVNGQTEHMFGYGRDELVGRPVEMLLPESARKRHVEHRAVFGANPAVRMMGAGLTLSARRKNGTVFPVEISLSPVAASDRRFVSTVIRDITDRKQLEDELVEARRAAERAHKANSAFLAAASHDLRQPVQALALLNGALRRAVKDPRALGLVESQQQSVRAMSNLLNSLLDISRLDAGAVSPDVETFPVQQAFDRLSAEFGRQAREKHLAFKARRCDALIRSDPNLLDEIIQNFVSNAIRYTALGSVELSAAVDGQTCRIQVTDTGIGIAADQVERIFEEFHQADGKASGKEGFGLGLAIVRRLADLLGHTIDVKSVPGEGSCFSVVVPLADPVTANRSETAAIQGDSSATSSGLILVIEDDGSVAGALRAVLEAEGFRVSLNSSARELRETLSALQETPVLIVSDFHLGEGATGTDLIGEIRDRFGATIPAFIISGDTSRVVRDARLVSDCVLLNKPVDTDKLVDLVHEAAARSALQV